MPISTPVARLLLPIVCGWLGVTAATAASIEFVAVLSHQNQMRFVLRDAAASSVSAWLTVGDTYRGYRIESYGTRSGTLTLAQGSERLQLQLVGLRSRRDEGRPALPVPPTRFVTVKGAVVEEGSLPHYPGLTVEQAIRALGGLKPAADPAGISVSGPVVASSDGKTSPRRIRTVDFKNPVARAYPLLPGDLITVPPLPPTTRLAKSPPHP